MINSKIFVATCEEFIGRLADRRRFESMVSNEAFEEYQAWLADRLRSIALAHAPLARCRELLAEAVTNLAFYEILAMDVEPRTERTAMRNQHGVSGELKGRLSEIASKNRRLKNELIDLKNASHDDILTYVLIQYCRWSSTANAWMAANNVIESLSVEQHRSWFKPFLHAMCVWQEDRIRRDLAMPRLLGREPLIAAHRAAAYHTFLRFVLDVAADPDAAWRAHFKRWLHRGELVAWTGH